MLCFLQIFSQSRKFWFILMLSALNFISASLFIQHFFSFKPCILCIYQRCALFGIVIASIIPLISPTNKKLKLISTLIWTYSAFKGLILSKTNIALTLHPSPFYTCDLFVSFPNWIPLNKWWPNIFDAKTGNCLDHQWYFLSLETSQWIFLIFINYLILALVTMVAQCIYFKR